MLDCLEPNPATGLVYLNDDDYDYNYERVPPVFLYPSQRRSRLDMERAEISYPTDQELETWLADPGLYRPQLRGALVVLRSRGDAHLKDTALRCAAIGDAHCSLKVEAFQVLAELKGDLDV